MTESLLWSLPEGDATRPTVHALVIGVSRYDHLSGGTGERSADPMFAGLGQLSAAATSATRMAIWLREHFAYPDGMLGSVRLLASPAPGELPLPEGIDPPPATDAYTEAALAAWRTQARSGPGNVTVLYVAGHGIQTGNEGGILLLQDVGAPGRLRSLANAVDLGRVRFGMVNDPLQPETVTPPAQYYLYDACRVRPAAVEAFEGGPEAGIVFDAPKGLAARTSWVLWASRSRDYALADPDTRATLFSQAVRLALESRATPEPDGRTIRYSSFGAAVEELVADLALEFGDEQTVANGGAGLLREPFYLRPVPAAPPVQAARTPDFPRSSGGDAAAPSTWPGYACPPPTQRSSPPRRWLSWIPSLTEGRRGAGGDTRGYRPLEDREPGPVQVTVTTASADPSVVTFSAPGEQERTALTGSATALPAGRWTVTVDPPWGRPLRDVVVVDGYEGSLSRRVDNGPTKDARPARLTRQLGAAGGGRTRWALRLLRWEAGRLVASSDGPGLAVDDVDDGTVSMTVEAVDQVLRFAQLRTEDGRCLLIGLPVAQGSDSTSSCALHVRVSETTLGGYVRLRDARLDACAGYLTGGRPDHLVSVLPDAEALLHGKVADPAAAALGAYALLRLNEDERLREWAYDLAEWFDWLPDGAVVGAETAARRGEDDRAAHYLLTAMERGLPVFSEGLSLLVNRAGLLVADPDVAEETRTRIADACRPLLALSPYADFSPLTTTLRLDPAPGPVTAGRGWRELADAPGAGGPRDLWRAPAPGGSW